MDIIEPYEIAIFVCQAVEYCQFHMFQPNKYLHGFILEKMFSSMNIAFRVPPI